MPGPREASRPKGLAAGAKSHGRCKYPTAALQGGGGYSAGRAIADSGQWAQGPQGAPLESCFHLVDRCGGIYYGGVRGLPKAVFPCSSRAQGTRRSAVRRAGLLQAARRRCPVQALGRKRVGVRTQARGGQPSDVGGPSLNLSLFPLTGATATGNERGNAATGLLQYYQYYRVQSTDIAQGGFDCCYRLQSTFNNQPSPLPCSAPADVRRTHATCIRLV